MSDPPKSSAHFPFAQPATSGSSSGLFGQGASNIPKQTGGLFGSGSNPPASSAANPFGNTSTAGGTSSVFGGSGGTTGGSNLFGGANKQSSGWNYAQPQDTNSSAGLFGSGQSGAQDDQPSSSAAPSIGLFSTPNKPSEQPATSQSQTSNLFGGGASTGAGFSFGNLGSNTSTAGQTSSTTPTSKPNPNLFGNSTTPAGPPPNTSSGGSSGSGLFVKPPQDSRNLFTTFGQSTSAQQPTTSTAAPSGGFGGFSLQAGKSQEPPASTSSTQPSDMFSSTPNAGASNPFSGFSSGSSKPQDAQATTSSAQPSSIFASPPNAGGLNIFGNKRGAESGEGLFSNLNKTQDTGVSKSGAPQQPQNEAFKGGNFFSLGGQPPANDSAPKTTSASLFDDGAPKPAFSVAKSPQEQPPATNSLASPAATPSGFNFLNKPTSSGTSAPSTDAPSGGIGNMFSNFGKPKDKAATTNDEFSGTSAPAASTLFGNLGKPATPSANNRAPAQPTTNQGVGIANANLGASTVGPAPTAQSRLKNKSIDDIITRWASDLSKYQKEFQQQAEKVAAWDCLLVDNSEKIQRLYGATLEAERATTEVERQLTAVENDQEELSMWLDHYEKEVDSMIANSVGQGDALSGPDQERERTYQLANKLSERLDEMGKDLGNMIEEINDVSSTLSKTGKADDPLTQVVRVLNSHLNQLQQIDQGTAALTSKVKEAQRAGQSMGPTPGLSSPSSDAADGFYRSFMGRR